jgi:hypothetical protein
LAVFDGNPDPFTVTVDPGGPLVGDSVMLPAAPARSNPIVVMPMKRIKIRKKEVYLFITTPLRSTIVAGIFILFCQHVNVLPSKFNVNFTYQIHNQEDANIIFFYVYDSTS